MGGSVNDAKRKHVQIFPFYSPFIPVSGRRVESCSYLRFFANIRIYLSDVRLARQGRAGPETHRLLHFSNAVMCIFRSTLRFFFFCLFDTFVVSSFWLVLLVALIFLLIGGGKAVVLACGLRGDWGRGGRGECVAVLCFVLRGRRGWVQ